MEETGEVQNKKQNGRKIKKGDERQDKIKNNKRGQVENEIVYFKQQWVRCKGQSKMHQTTYVGSTNEL